MPFDNAEPAIPFNREEQNLIILADYLDSRDWAKHRSPGSPDWFYMNCWSWCAMGWASRECEALQAQGLVYDRFFQLPRMADEDIGFIGRIGCGFRAIQKLFGDIDPVQLGELFANNCVDPHVMAERYRQAARQRAAMRLAASAVAA